MNTNTGIKNIHLDLKGRYIYNKTVVGIRYTFSSFILKEVVEHKKKWETLNCVGID